MTRRPPFLIVTGTMFVAFGIIMAFRLIAGVGFVREAIAGYALAAAMIALGVVRIASSLSILRTSRSSK